MPIVEGYMGIDYSAESTAEASLKEIRAYAATGLPEPQEVAPPVGLRKYWSRRGIASWLCGELLKGPATIVGMDHAFSFPLAYFEKHGLPLDWPGFLDDFQRHCPPDQENICVDFIRDGIAGSSNQRAWEPSWLRLTEQGTASAKSVSLFDVQGAVAK